MEKSKGRAGGGAVGTQGRKEWWPLLMQIDVLGHQAGRGSKRASHAVNMASLERARCFLLLSGISM